MYLVLDESSNCQNYITSFIYHPKVFCKVESYNLPGFQVLVFDVEGENSLVVSHMRIFSARPVIYMCLSTAKILAQEKMSKEKL